MTLRLIVGLLIINAAAGQTRYGDAPQTITRTVGQSVVAALVVGPQSLAVKTIVYSVAYDPALVTPRVPGSAQPAPGPGSVAYDTTVAGVVTVTWTATAPVVPPVEPLASIVFDCKAPGTTRLAAKSYSIKDGAGALVVCTAAAQDTLVINAPPVALEMRLQP